MLKPDAKITINMDKQTVKIVENADIITTLVSPCQKRFQSDD